MTPCRHGRERLASSHAGPLVISAVRSSQGSRRSSLKWGKTGDRPRCCGGRLVGCCPRGVLLGPLSGRLSRPALSPVCLSGPPVTSATPHPAADVHPDLFTTPQRRQAPGTGLDWQHSAAPRLRRRRIPPLAQLPRERRCQVHGLARPCRDPRGWTTCVIPPPAGHDRGGGSPARGRQTAWFEAAILADGPIW